MIVDKGPQWGRVRAEPAVAHRAVQCRGVGTQIGEAGPILRIESIVIDVADLLPGPQHAPPAARYAWPISTLQDANSSGGFWNVLFVTQIACNAASV
ncbi:hypothetical protein [Cellulomonas sp. NPDC089187]|uniref:hypothetical protein n=1 Tax=Cellulomonas sp. NPDC089187 TaxID=3154970 RepID=UPI0034232E21